MKFCGECGARLSAPQRREERKVVSVLFADLVGFTSRSEQLDVEDVRGTLAPFHAALRKVLESFGGTVEKFIGDAVMAVFGAPIAHEDDAERAVRAGLAIREAIGELAGDLHVRIGINTGEALVSLGADTQSEGMVAGDVVNTAARLQSAAPIDGVLVGDATYQSTERQIIFEAHPPIDAKGKTEPVVCWVAQQPRSLVPDSDRLSFPLVGRERERRMLIDAFERSRAEHQVQLVTVVGVPGIGKSRLVAELSAYADADPELTTWRHGRVLSYGEGVAFYALAEIVKQECGILGSDDTLVAATKLDTAIAALGLDGGNARWARNQVGPLIGVAGPIDGSTQSDAFAGWRMFLEAIAAESPAVLVFDDLHWADNALLDFVDELVDRVTDVPLLVVATSRPELLERRPGWSGGKTNALTIGLSPLSADETLSLIDGLIDRALLPDGAETRLVERASGNPFYAQEYVRTIVERGSAAGEDLPESVQGIISARLDGLSPAEKSLLQDAAVLGTTAWFGGLCELGNRERDMVEDLTRRLERKQLVRRERRSTIADDTEITFTHALIHDVAYQQLPRAARAQRHQQAAAWLERVATDRADTAELIAHHYTTALELETALGHDTEALRPGAITALLNAGRQAAARHDHTATVRYAELALTLSPETQARAELLALAAVARNSTGTADESVLLGARDAAVSSGRLEDAVHLTYLLVGWSELYAADSERMSAYEKEALSLAAGLPPGPIATLPAYLSAYKLLIGGHYDEAIQLANTEIARAIEAGSDAAVGLMLMWRGSARADTGDDGGIADLREAARLLEEQVHPMASVAARNLGDMLLGLGRLAEASAAFEAARTNSHRSGYLVSESATATALAAVAFHRGDPATAQAWLDGTADSSDLTTGEAASLHGRIVLERSPHEAIGGARQLLEFGRATDNPEKQCDALALVARAEIAMGDAVAADRSLDAYLEAWGRIGGTAVCAPSLVEAGLAFAARDRHRELAAATDLLRTRTPWTDAAHALAERRYADAAAILDSIPSIPLRDAARAL
jgi:class 3 adenylate cyclase